MESQGLYFEMNQLELSWISTKSVYYLYSQEYFMDHLLDINSLIIYNVLMTFSSVIYFILIHYSSPNFDVWIWQEEQIKDKNIGTGLIYIFEINQLELSNNKNYL